MGSRERPFIMHLVHSLECGGTERVLVSLLRAFDHGAMRHAVVTQRTAGPLAAQLSDEIACIPLALKGRARMAGLRLAQVCRHLRPAVLHARNVNTWSDALAARIFCPTMRLVLGFHGLQGGAGFSRRDRTVARIANKMGARFASVSLHGRRKMASELGLRHEQIHYLPNGIHLPSGLTRKSGSMRSQLGYGTDEFVLGIVGSLTPVKGHELLLSAIAVAKSNNPQLRLLVVGGGPLKAPLEAVAAALGLQQQVRFLGPRNDVPDILSALNGYVCASHSEGMSNALLEAMAAELPVVSTDVGDHSLLIRDGIDGLLVPPNNPKAMAEAIQSLMSARAQAHTMARNAVQRVREFDFTKAVSAYECFYSGLAAPPSRRSNQSQAFVAECQNMSLAPAFLASPPPAK